MKEEETASEEERQFDECKLKLKGNSTIDYLAKRLLFLARKCYLNWMTNKDLLLLENCGKVPQFASRSGTHTKVSSKPSSICI